MALQQPPAKAGFALADYALMRQAASLQEDKQYARAAEVYASLPQAFSAIEVLFGGPTRGRQMPVFGRQI